VTVEFWNVTRDPPHGVAPRWMLEHVEHPSQQGEAGPAALAVTVSQQPMAGADDCYRLLAQTEQDDLPGQYWTIIRLSFNGHPDEEEAFNAWYSTKHMLEVCANPGFHRAWRLQRVAGDDFAYWAVYEVDSPDDFAEVRRRNTNPWDGLWVQQVEGFRRTYYRVSSAS
jgi:hypothetical protein